MSRKKFDITKCDLEKTPPLNRRIAEVFVNNKEYGTEFASKIGISRGFLSEILHGRSKPSVETLIGILNNYQVDPEWLFLGKGRMCPKQDTLGGEGTKAEVCLTDFGKILRPPIYYKSEGQETLRPAVCVPYAQEEAKEGDGLASVFLEIPKNWLSGVFHRGWDALLSFCMDSDNMDPTLRMGDLIFIDQKHDQIKGAGIYAFREGRGGILIRRIQMNMDGIISEVNDNPQYANQNKNYMPSGGSGHPQLLGRVVLVARRP